jgi:signal transduction histidine kinase
VGKKRLETLLQNLLKKNEDDRRAIAYDLHDEIGQDLAALKIYLQTRRKGEAAAKNISSQRKSVLILDQLMQRMRDLSLNLRPSLLDDLGLIETLRWWIEHQNLQKEERI